MAKKAVRSISPSFVDFLLQERTICQRLRDQRHEQLDFTLNCCFVDAFQCSHRNVFQRCIKFLAAMRVYGVFT